MRWKSYVLVREDGTEPGIYGDSCNETGNFHTLISPPFNTTSWNSKSVSDSLKTFITPKGFIRHPDVPDDWKESDFSSDQALPLLTAAASWDIAWIIADFFNKIQYTTGNGDLISPPLWATMRRVKKSSGLYFSDLALWAAAQLVVYSPWRWNDEKKSIEKANDDSTDWKVLFCALWYAEHHNPTSISKKTLRFLIEKGFLDQMKQYYSKESPWIIELYQEVIKTIK